jgi:hypothetical protein
MLKAAIVEEHDLNDLIGFDDLAEGDHFVYQVYCCGKLTFEFFAIKADESHAVFLNARQKFIIANKYKNCLSIGDYCVSSPIEYDSFAEAKKAIKH